MSRVHVREGEPLPDDATVLIQMGAGDHHAAAKQALRNYDDYRDTATELRKPGYGLFCVSLYAVTGDVTRDQIFDVMPHKQFGEATVGELRQLGDLLATTTEDEDMPEEIQALQEAHFDFVLEEPPDLPELHERAAIDLSEEEQRQVEEAFLPQLEKLFALFLPRGPKKPQ